MSNKRLLVIGLDGYETTVAEALIEEGLMPNLAALKNTSARYQVEAGEEKFTGLAWEHFSYGRDSRETDRWTAVSFNPDSYFVDQLPTQLFPFLHGKNRQSLIFDVPYFKLKNADNAVGMVNWGAHDPGVEAFARPASLAEEIEDRFGSYKAKQDIYAFTWPSARRTEETGRRLTAAVDQRKDICEWLLTERLPDWELAVITVSELHSVIEPMWHGVDTKHPLHNHASADYAKQAICDVYQATDCLIGALAEQFPDADTLLFSLHGMGPNDADVTSMALLPELLYRIDTGKKALRVPKRWKQPETPLLEEDQAWDSEVRKSIKLRKSLAEWVETGFAQEQRSDASGALWWMPASMYQRCWKRMKAFALPSFYDGRIRLNVVGREKNGQIRPQDYSEYCQRIKRILNTCVDQGTGKKAIKEVQCPGGNDPFSVSSSQADIIVRWAEPTTNSLFHPDYGVIGPLPYRRTGGHTGGHGIMYLSADRFEAGDYGIIAAESIPARIQAYFE